MATLFDKVSGTYESFDSNGITDNEAAFKENEFKDWYVVIGGVEFKIISNTATTLSFSNTLTATGSYEIVFIGRVKLTEIESDFSDSVKIPDALISKKYNQTNIDMSNRLFAYLRGLFGMNTGSFVQRSKFTNDFNPLENILNIEIMQQSFCYYLSYLIFKDLSIRHENNQNFVKSEDFFTLFKETIKDNLALIQIDFNEDGEADSEEKRNSVSYNRLTR